MPTSSTVWCRSTSRSPFASSVRSKPAVLAELLEHVVEERDAGRRSRSRRCRRRRDRRSIARLRGLALLSCAARRRHSRHLLQGAAERGEERVVLRRRADGDPQALVEPGPAREVADEHAAREQRLPHRVAVAVRRGTAGSSRPTGTRSTPSSSLSAANSRPRSSTSVATRRSISSRCSSASVPASWVGTDRWYGSTTFSSSATSHSGRDREPEPHRGQRPHLRVGAHDHERRGRRRRARARSTARTRRRPRRRRAAPPLSRDRRSSSASTTSRGSTVPVGLFGLHTNTIAGRCRAISAAAASRSIAKSRRRARPRRPRSR